MLGNFWWWKSRLFEELMFERFIQDYFLKAWKEHPAETWKEYSRRKRIKKNINKL